MSRGGEIRDLTCCATAGPQLFPVKTGAFELDRKRCRSSTERLLVAECDKGIHLSSAARGQQAGGETDKRNDDYHRDERPWIGD
jgi:hypothetical protein